MANLPRVTQTVVEALLFEDAVADVRLTQMLVEALIVESSAIRLTQTVVEVLIVEDQVVEVDALSLGDVALIWVEVYL